MAKNLSGFMQLPLTVTDTNSVSLDLGSLYSSFTLGIGFHSA